MQLAANLNDHRVDLVGAEFKLVPGMGERISCKVGSVQHGGEYAEKDWKRASRVTLAPSPHIVHQRLPSNNQLHFIKHIPFLTASKLFGMHLESECARPICIDRISAAEVPSTRLSIWKGSDGEECERGSVCVSLGGGGFGLLSLERAMRGGVGRSRHLALRCTWLRTPRMS